jgi:hypothetical protein
VPMSGSKYRGLALLLLGWLPLVLCAAWPVLPDGLTRQLPLGQGGAPASAVVLAEVSESAENVHPRPVHPMARAGGHDGLTEMRTANGWLQDLLALQQNWQFGLRTAGAPRAPSLA